MKSICAGFFVGVAGLSLGLQLSPAQAATETVLHSFNSNGKDGYDPLAGVIDVRGKLYGTTPFGGRMGYGTTFAVNTATTREKVLHSFQSDPDGATPYAPLLSIKGVLYGTTMVGGSGGRSGGTVFSFDWRTHTEKVVYYFCGQSCEDGQNPEAGLIELNGVLYGTTAAGGGNNNCVGEGGCGTVFSLDPKTRKETVLYSFCNGGEPCADGQQPYASLVNVNGTLYGTTWFGGTGNCDCGTVYSVDPGTGAEKVVYSFSWDQGPTTIDPSNLLNVNGTLYGETGNGGECDSGTVFGIDPGTGTEIFECSFGGFAGDGYAPAGGVIYVNGTLYGVTFAGGAGTCQYPNCGGTVFALDPNTGVETVLYSFCPNGNPCTDGFGPLGVVTNMNGMFYGTTRYGGAYDFGTVFAVTP